MNPAMTVRILDRGDVDVLERVAPGVFDHTVDRERAEAFLADPHLHIAVAIANGQVVGFASAVDYIHPDKPRHMWINEVGVAPDCRKAGVGASVLEAMLAQAEAIGCDEPWVLTDADNRAANALYLSAGGREERPGQRMYVFALRDGRGDQGK
ncbi:MAG TPA: GNAT family N-acetyltransferase [Sphingomicrobium sp.]